MKMNYLRHGTCVILALAVFLPSITLANKDQLTEKLLMQAGIAEHTKQIPLIVWREFSQGIQETSQFPDPIVEKLKAIIQESYNSEEMLQFISKRLSSSLSRHDMENIVSWLESPLGKKITSLEKAASAPEVYQEIEQFGSVKKNFNIPPERLALINRLDDSSRGTESAVDTAINTQIGIMLAMSATLPAEARSSVDQIREMVESQRFYIEGRVTNVVLASMIYTYKQLDDAELKKYVDFSESTTGTNYFLVTNQAVSDAFLESSRKAGTAIGKMINELADSPENQ